MKSEYEIKYYLKNNSSSDISPNYIQGTLMVVLRNFFIPKYAFLNKKKNQQRKNLLEKIGHLEKRGRKQEERENIQEII